MKRPSRMREQFSRYCFPRTFDRVYDRLSYYLIPDVQVGSSFYLLSATGSTVTDRDLQDRREIQIWLHCYPLPDTRTYYLPTLLGGPLALPLNLQSALLR